MSIVRIAVVSAGVSEPSSTRLLADRLANSIAGQLESVQVDVIDLRDIAVDVAQGMLSGFAIGGARDAVRAVEEADAVIAATPVFNASYSGLFKSFFDIVDKDTFVGKPVLIAATGGSPRHSMVLDHALRPLFAYLRAVVVPSGVYAASEDWAAGSGDTATLADRVERATGELAALLGGRVRRAEQVDTEEAGISNFARLLGDSLSQS
ncbi:MAG: oxidoreductase [Gordonia sp.]|uniref:FMN reductase n=1 Tax=Williamsia sp. 1138 TaxID=1903117 RepID=UPI000A0F90EE|nr:FMN reductase [Williamsia sp. 1138]MBA4022199.1 oxidoreductase [Gordonia sp. (in: high G+C Gram-positive bacteria)]OZG29971.1 oxidoreductase [Williamsia sp. 1138]